MFREYPEIRSDRAGWRRRLAAAAAVVALAGTGVACGEDEEPGSSGPTSLTVTVRPEGDDGPAERREIACPGHELCDRLERVPLSAFDPVPPTTACTEIYGGPATARVEGTLRGEAVSARFARHDGCEIGRWDRLQWLLGRVPGVTS